MTSSTKLDEHSFSDTCVNDREGDYTDEVTGVTLLRDDVAKARMEEKRWYEKIQAFDEVPDETCVLRTGISRKAHLSIKHSQVHN